MVIVPSTSNKQIVSIFLPLRSIDVVIEENETNLELENRRTEKKSEMSSMSKKCSKFYFFVWFDEKVLKEKKIN